jgi:hypothetical protein
MDERDKIRLTASSVLFSINRKRDQWNNIEELETMLSNNCKVDPQ